MHFVIREQRQPNPVFVWLHPNKRTRNLMMSCRLFFIFPPVSSAYIHTIWEKNLIIIFSHKNGLSCDDGDWGWWWGNSFSGTVTQCNVHTCYIMWTALRSENFSLQYFTLVWVTPRVKCFLPDVIWSCSWTKKQNCACPCSTRKIMLLILQQNLDITLPLGKHSKYE